MGVGQFGTVVGAGGLRGLACSRTFARGGKGMVHHRVFMDRLAVGSHASIQRTVVILRRKSPRGIIAISIVLLLVIHDAGE